MSAHTDAQNIANALADLEAKLYATPFHLGHAQAACAVLHSQLSRGLTVHGPTLGLTPSEISEIQGGGTPKPQ